MRYFIGIIFFLITFLTNAEEVNKIIAKVNNLIITQKDLDDFCKMLKYRLGEDIDIGTDDKNFKKEALERLIEDKLILEQAKKENIKIPSSIIDAKINEISSNFSSREEFEEYLINKGLNISRLRERIEEQFLVREVLNKYVRSYISISPKQVNDFYNQHPEIFVSPSKFNILIAQNKNKNYLVEIGKYIKTEGIEKAKTKYEDIFTDLEATETELRKDILEVIKNLKENEFTIKKIDGTYYLLYIEKLTPPQQLSFDDAKKNAYEYLFNLAFKQRYNEWVSQLKQKAAIKIYE